jgi:hypothetical protein
MRPPVDLHQNLQKRIHDAELHRPMRIEGYEPGAELSYDITGVPRRMRGGSVSLLRSSSVEDLPAKYTKSRCSTLSQRTGR